MILKKEWTIIIFTHILNPLTSLEHTLLQSTKLDSLEWESYPEKGTSSLGWRETSTNVKHGQTIRIHRVCDIDESNVNNWLRTPYIQRGDAHRIFIEMKFTMRKCTKYPSPKQLQQCKESFRLLYYEAESDFANIQMPTWDVETYSSIDNIAADIMWNDLTSNDDSIINTEIRSVEVKRAGVYFSFLDEGSCTALMSVRVYYKYCPSIIINYASFSNVTTGGKLSDIKRVEGSCIANADIDEMPVSICKADGHWSYPTGSCSCKPGFHNLIFQDQVSCTACKKGSFKYIQGNEDCIPCPDHSTSKKIARTFCSCKHGYYRTLFDDKTTPCTEPPSHIENLAILNITQTSANITWSKPSSFGGRQDLYFDVTCDVCGSLVIFSPSHTKIKTPCSFNSW